MVSISGVNVVQALVQAEMRILVLEKIVETILNSRVRTESMVTIDLKAIHDQALHDLQIKYPDLGIKVLEK
jgi:hypothetical protein